ncbi:hypothetical protein V8C42DRAFT_336835 [Trichoderma barbatum]
MDDLPRWTPGGRMKVGNRYKHTSGIVMTLLEQTEVPGRWGRVFRHKWSSESCARFSLAGITGARTYPRRPSRTGEDDQDDQDGEEVQGENKEEESMQGCDSDSVDEDADDVDEDSDSVDEDANDVGKDKFGEAAGVLDERGSEEDYDTEATEPFSESAVEEYATLDYNISSKKRKRSGDSDSPLRHKSQQLSRVWDQPGLLRLFCHRPFSKTRN